MKRLLLLIAVSIVWSGSVLQAQEYEYVPLVREGVEWGYTGDLGDYRCQIKGDTIIDGTTYKKFYRYTTCGLQKNTPCYVAVRENDKKVYYREITGD